MTEPPTTMEEPPLLSLPLPGADPVSGCARCRYWDSQRSTARRAGDGASVTDCNVHIRRHPY